MLFYFEIFFTLILVIISIKALKKNQFMLFLFSIFTVFYIMIRHILLLSGNYINFAILNQNITVFNHTAVLYVFIYIVVSYFIFVISYFIIYKKKLFINNKYSKKRDISKIIILFFLLILSFTLSKFVGMMYLMYLFIYDFYRRVQYRFLLWFEFFVLLLLFTFTDDRRNWLLLILSLLFILFTKIKNKNLVKIVTSGLVSLVLLSYILVAFRTDGLFNYEAVYDRFTEHSNVIMPIFEIESDFPIVSDDVVVLFDRLLVKDNLDYTYGVNFCKPFYSFIPRTIWEEKPISISRLFAKENNPSFYEQGGSEPITIYGELFWNFGYISFIFYILFAYISVFLDKKVISSLEENNNSDLALYLMFIASTFIILRGPLDNFWLMYAYTIILVFIEKNLVYILDFKKKGNYV